jgi:cephalosporin-C deacetylase
VPLFDLSPDELVDHRPARSEPADFDAFWTATLTEARERPLAVDRTPCEPSLPLVEAEHLTFAGFAGDRVHALLLRPDRRVVEEPPVVVQYLGYGDGTGSPLDWLALPAAGFATLVMDTRGQGARARRAGRTGDPSGSGTAHVEGFLTRGILDPADYYYRRVFTDAVRAVDVAAGLEDVDHARIAVAGTSQGGGIALAAAAWATPVSAAVVNVPFLCAPARAVEVTERAPYAELLAFLRGRRRDGEQALRTLGYVDGVNHAARARVPALFSVALMDQVCPPSTVYAAYNHYAGPKSIEVYRWNEHEGGGLAQDETTISWLRERFAGEGGHR